MYGGWVYIMVYKKRKYFHHFLGGVTPKVKNYHLFWRLTLSQFFITLCQIILSVNPVKDINQTLDDSLQFWQLCSWYV